MDLDHVRDYFHYGSFYVDPTDLETTTPILFFTRFITHYCTPIFVLLVGTSASLDGSKNQNQNYSNSYLRSACGWFFLRIRFQKQ
ncbi:hypothetical protein [Marivirga tractuosa]|uniref:hypothetical protein n=1 Tax=Marivirga tractuosa TaxID=1006 RepID=UPI0002EBFEDB|nr:hypothetical protein [Marivirga tractuosa]